MNIRNIRTHKHKKTKHKSPRKKINSEYNFEQIQTVGIQKHWATDPVPRQ